MNKKLYDLMNWPEIEGIVYSESDDPQALLGGHAGKDGFLVQAFRPDAVDMWVSIDGKDKKYPMEKVDEAGFFAALLPNKKKAGYTLTVENLQGKKQEYRDAYAYGSQLDPADVKKFLAGTSRDAYRFMGSHVMTVDGTQGVHFAVWAPNAIRVSVVGSFNRWDGRLHQMVKDAESGIFTLFIPGLSHGEVYNYEVKMRDKRIQLKADPYCQDVVCSSQYQSVVPNEAECYAWKDASWYRGRKNADRYSEPMAICELDIDSLMRENIVEEIAELGFNYVQLMSVCSAAAHTPQSEALSYFAPHECLGSQKLKARIDAFHSRNIGVIADWKAAFMGSHPRGLVWFDGTPLYEMNTARLNQQPDLNVSTFDYAKPQVCSFLYSSMAYWVEQYHIDGICVDETASMLYLDYGRHAGEWIPNMYGGNENLAAIEFLKNLRRAADQMEHVPLLAAEENSSWPKVTADLHNNGLGFDYKWNNGWKKEFVSFMETDPLFRKGIYGKLTYSLLYQYSENFILEMSHKGVSGNQASLYDRLPSLGQAEGSEDMEKQRSIRAALVFMYTHPGKKLLNIREFKGLEPFVAALNRAYMENAALYSLDNMPEGFEWLDNVSAQETVFAYLRRASDGSQILAAVNFTPVLREHFKIGVAEPGKYTPVFNSEDSAYGGSMDLPEEPLRSLESEWNGRANSIEVTLPPMGAVIYAYTEYTEYELEEMRIRQEAAKAKAKAEAECREAELLRLKAEEQAKLAQEAQERAVAAAKEAMEAKLAAEKKAKLAVRTSMKIDEEMEQKLDALREKQKGG